MDVWFVGWSKVFVMGLCCYGNLLVVVVTDGVWSAVVGSWGIGSFGLWIGLCHLNVLRGLG